MTISGNGGLSFGTLGTAQTVASVDASGVSGDITAAVVMTGSFKSGTGDDTISISDANAGGIGNNRNIDGGDGADSLVFAANDDFSAATLTLANIETLNVAASGITVSGAQVSGKGYNIVGDATADSLAIAAQVGTGETINISSSEIVLATVTITGSAGADILTGSATSATTINGGNAADTIVGGSGDDLLSGNNGDDTLTGGDGSDTFFIDLFSANGSDTINDFVKADDDIDLDVAVTGSTISGEEAVAAKAAVATTADDELYVFADASQDITGTAGSGIADFTDLADVANFLDTAITAADTHEYLAILNDAAGTTAYVFHIAEATENDGDDDITSGDLTLLATITTDAAITTGETIIA
jgi:Ca2+-binding RTX toxin-like protein